MILTKFQSPAKVQSIFRHQARKYVPSSHLQKSQLSNSGCQPQAKELSKTGRHLTILPISSAHHDQGKNSQQQYKGQQYRDRSQSSETNSRGRSRRRKWSNREFDRHRSRDRKSRHRSSERIHHRSSPSDGRRRSRRRDSQDASGRHRRSPARNQVGDDRN